MFFKQVKILKLSEPLRYSAQELAKRLEALAFTPCLPSLPSSQGWVSPVNEEEAPLVQSIQGYTMFCYQIEEKILPASYVHQELLKKQKAIEKEEGRKLRSKEKLELKEQLIATFLPRAFSKLTRIYAYLDPQNDWLLVGTQHAKRLEQFRAFFERSLHEKLEPVQVENLGLILTQWVKHQNYAAHFSLEKACLLQDPDQQNRMIRCQQQDLLAASVQAFIKDGCQVKQLALSWQDRLRFVLSDDFSLSRLQYPDELLSEIQDLEAETAQQKFAADFLMMSGTLAALLKDLQEALKGRFLAAVS